MFWKQDDSLSKDFDINENSFKSNPALSQPNPDIKDPFNDPMAGQQGQAGQQQQGINDPFSQQGQFQGQQDNQDPFSMQDQMPQQQGPDPFAQQGMQQDPFSSDPFGNQQAPQGPPGFGQYSQQSGMQQPQQGMRTSRGAFKPVRESYNDDEHGYSSRKVKDTDLIVSKLDTIRVMLDNINQRLSMIEENQRKDRTRW